MLQETNKNPVISLNALLKFLLSDLMPLIPEVHQNKSPSEELQEAKGTFCPLPQVSGGITPSKTLLPISDFKIMCSKYLATLHTTQKGSRQVAHSLCANNCGGVQILHNILIPAPKIQHPVSPVRTKTIESH